ncbi:NAD-dependent epimerase/dehydratase family protein [Natronobacterium lacisalsi]|nr:NAD-dependent epimerase/dehydratase family protein [Halobiforma lacisalsi]
MSETERETVGVLGATGYVGRAAVAALRERGYEVMPAAGSDHEEFPAVDVRDRGAVRTFVDDVDALVNAAGLVGIDACEANPAAALEINGLGAATVAWACARAEVPIVHLSSVATVGVPDPDEGPITAATERRPGTAYGRTKLLGERAVRTVTNGRVPSITYSATNVYGRREPGAPAGNSVLDFYLERAVADETLTVHRPGTQELDFVHVRDVAAAVARAVDVFSGDQYEPETRSYVLGRGRSYSVLEVAGLVADGYRRRTGSPLGIELRAPPSTDEPTVERFDVDPEPLRSELGVDPERTVSEWIGTELERRLGGTGTGTGTATAKEGNGERRSQDSNLGQPR